jgi:hypothetical protein
MKRIIIFLLVILMMLPNTGCNLDALASAFTLVSDDSTYNATAVAIAVDAVGWKHVVWSECSAVHHCRIVYTKFLFSHPTNFTYIVPFQPTVYSYQDPDIAVTDSGIAYLVFRREKIADGTFIDCFNIPSVDTACNVGQTIPTPVSYGLPHVAARGEVVYMVREDIDGTGTTLNYEQLRPLDHSFGRVGGVANILNTDADLAISRDGTLHVMWRNTTNPTPIHYNDNYGTTGDMAGPLVTSPGKLTAPKIACDDTVDDSGYCFYVYGDKAPTSDTMTIGYFQVRNRSGFGGLVNVNLSSNPNWVLYGNPALAAAGTGTGSSGYLAFVATNAQSPTIPQVYGLTWPNGNPAPSPNLRTNPAGNYPDYKSSPLIIAITGEFLGGPFTSGVTAWRSTYAIPGADYDAYLWDDSQSVRKIFTSYHPPAGDDPKAFDIAGNGKLAGGVWIDEQNSRSTRKVPWVSLNHIPAYLPLIAR